MPAYGATDLARSFRTVRNNTIKIAEEIPEEKYSFRATEGTRSIAELLAHIAVTPSGSKQFHIDRVPFDFAAVLESMQKRVATEATLTTKAQILDALRQGGEEIGNWLESLSEEFLSEVVSFPPPIQPSQKTRFEMLLSVKEHEMHHRGQLMVLQRLVGVTPHLTRDMDAAIAFVKEKLAASQTA